jgi:uncharacterized protein YndB with AHSA1/START domain
MEEITTEIISTTPETEIVSTRIFNAQIDLVFSAWTDPEHLKNWWGPKGFTNTFHQFDLRPGGIWKFTMHGPDKGHYQNECEFIKIERPSFIAWRRLSKPLFQVVAAFESVGTHKTRVVFKMLFTSEEECRKIKVFAVEKNEENFDRLEEELRRMSEK